MKPLSFENTEIAFQSKTRKELNKSYWIFKLISNNSIVKISIKLLRIAFFLKLPIKSIIKHTIFKQFCGGESIENCNDRIKSLAKYNIGTILDYSVEGKSRDEDFDRVTNETIRTILKAKVDENIPFAVFKISGIAPIELLEKVNNSKNELNEHEKLQLNQLNERVNNICKTAHKNNVRIFIDAEESWIQNTIDNIAINMMRKFNHEKAIVFNTLQMYRWDRLAYLKQCYADSENGKYYLGLKIVRGAYMQKERERAEKIGYPSPIQKDKLSCDKDYNLALHFCIKHINKITLCAGTHNEESSMLLTKLMSQYNIDSEDKRVYFSQLLGMSEHISYNLSKFKFNVAKYMPYGEVIDVIPYLIRRAEENTSITGQTGRELGLIEKEKKRRN